MTKDTITLMARYNQHANTLMNQVLSTLTPEEWEAPRGTYFSSIRDLCNHIYLSDVHALITFRARRFFAALKGDLFEFPPARTELAFRTFAEYQSARNLVDEVYLALAAEVSPEDLASNVTFRNFKGEDVTKNFGGRLLHLFNHQTHHRGQISALLDQLGKANDFSGVMAVL